MIAQCGLTYWPPLQAMFATEGLDLHTWRNIIAAGACLFVLVEIEKTAIRWHNLKFSHPVNVRPRK